MGLSINDTAPDFEADIVTPANWKPGGDVMIHNSVSDDQARVIFGEWKSVKPYIRIVPQPR